MAKKKWLLVTGVLVVLFVVVFLVFKIGQQQGEKGEKFKRTNAEERLAELLDVPIVKEEYTSEEVVEGNKKETESKLVDVNKEQLKLITERVGYIKDNKVSLWVTLGNVSNLEMRSFSGESLINGVRYKDEYLNTNSVNDLLQVSKETDTQGEADKVYLILDNSNLYMEYDVYKEKEAEEINSSFKTVSSNGLKVDLMLEYSLGYKGKQDSKGNRYVQTLNVMNNSKEKQRYNFKLYTKSSVKTNGLGTLIYNGTKVLNERETANMNLTDILKGITYEENKLVWLIKVTSAKDFYRAEETEIIIEVK